MSSVQPLLGAAGRHRSPATTPGFRAGRRREAGMDSWAWSAIAPWVADRLQLPVGPLFCVIDGTTRGRAWSASAARTELRAIALKAE